MFKNIFLGIMLCLAVVSAYAELFQVETFESFTYNVTVDNLAGSGALGGLWDTESDNTGNIKIAGAQGVNQMLLVSGHSSGQDRGGGINALTNPVDNTQSGVLFFRFQVRDGQSRPVRTYMGMHHHTGTNFLTSSTNKASQINAGFTVYRSAKIGRA